jgi:hypothetical protein
MAARGTRSAPCPRCGSACSTIKGALDAAWDLVKDWVMEEREALRNAVPKLALDAPLPGGGTLKDIAGEVLEIARSGLNARARLNERRQRKRDSSIRSHEIVRSGKVPAQRLLDLYHGEWAAICRASTRRRAFDDPKTVVIIGHFRLPARKHGCRARTDGAASSRQPAMSRAASNMPMRPIPAIPGLIHVSEVWESREALDAHFTTPHMKQWQAERAEFGMLEREITLYTASSSERLSRLLRRLQRGPAFRAYSARQPAKACA